jgi:hypothetical protein
MENKEIFFNHGENPPVNNTAETTIQMVIYKMKRYAKDQMSLTSVGCSLSMEIDLKDERDMIQPRELQNFISQ